MKKLLLLSLFAACMVGCKKSQTTGKYCWHCTLYSLTGEQTTKDTCTDTNDPTKVTFVDSNNNAMNSVCSP